MLRMSFGGFFSATQPGVAAAKATSSEKGAGGDNK